MKHAIALTVVGCQRIYRHCFMLLMCMTLCSISSHGQTIAQHWLSVSRFSHGLHNPWVGTNSGGTLVAGSPDGIFVSLDSGQTFARSLPLHEHIRIEDIGAIDSNGDSIVIVTGNDIAQSGGSMFRSSDAGRSWQEVTSASRDNTKYLYSTDIDLKFYSETAVRFQDLFSTDAGLSWRQVSPGPLSETSPDGTRMLGEGEFVCAFGLARGWYQADLQARVWRLREDLPYKYPSIYRLQQGTLIGWLPSGAYAGLAIKETEDTAWKEVTSVVTSHGETIDSLYIDELVFMNDRFVVVVDELGRIIRTDGTAFDTLRLFDKSRGRILRYKFHDDSLLITEAAGTFYVINCHQLTYRAIPAVGSIDFATVNGELFSSVRRDRLYRYSTQLKQWLRTGRIIEHGATSYAESFVNCIPQGMDIIVEDSERGIYAIRQSDSLFRVMVTSVDAITPKTTGSQRLIPIKMGRGWNWLAGDDIVTGGRRLRRWRLNSNSEVVLQDTLRPDTTIAFYVHDGQMYAGYRDLYESTDGVTWHLVPVVPDEDSTGERGLISSILRLGDGSLLLGRRGYKVYNNGTELTKIVHGGLLRSTNDDLTWIPVQLPIDDGYVVALATEGDGTLWASTTSVSYMLNTDTSGAFVSDFAYQHDAHVLRSSDGGNTWTQVFTQPYNSELSYSTRNFTFDGALIVATLSDRIMISSNAGTDWVMIEGLPNTDLNAARFDSDHNLWIATGIGLWKVDKGSITSVAAEDRKDDVEYSVSYDAEVVNIDITLKSGSESASAFAVDLMGQAYPVESTYHGSNMRVVLRGPSGLYVVVVHAPTRELMIPVLVVK